MRSSPIEQAPEKPPHLRALRPGKYGAIFGFIVGLFWAFDIREAHESIFVIIGAIVGGSIFYGVLFYGVAWISIKSRERARIRQTTATESIVQPSPKSLSKSAGKISESAAATSMAAENRSSAQTGHTIVEGHNMTKRQRLIIMWTMGIAVAMLLFPPFSIRLQNGVVTNLGYSFLFDPPRWGETSLFGSVDIGLLAAQWLVLVAVGAALWWLAKGSVEATTNSK